MDLEGIMLSEVSRSKTNIVWYCLYVESKKYNKLVNITHKKQIHRYREQTVDYQWGDEREEEQIKGRDLEVQTTRYKVSYYKYVLHNVGNMASIL